MEKTISFFEKSVFINCPFDDAYKPLLKVLIFTLVKFGMTPRIALENSDSGKARIIKILELIKESKYSIHDLSRLKSTKSEEFHRMNMPFELGIDFGARNFSPVLASKKFLILEASNYDYMKALSDMNRFDIKVHKNDPEELIKSIRSWLIETVGLRDIDAQMKVWYQFADFSEKIFESKFKKYSPEYTDDIATNMANQEVNNMPIPEFTSEVEIFFSS